MTAKQHTDTVVVKLTAPATIGNVSFAVGATVALPPETAAWLVEQGSARIIDDGKEVAAKKNK